MPRSNQSGFSLLEMIVATALTGLTVVGLLSLTSQSLDEIDESAARRKIWQANIAEIRAGGWFGAGAGSHARSSC